MVSRVGCPHRLELRHVWSASTMAQSLQECPRISIVGTRRVVTHSNKEQGPQCLSFLGQTCPKRVVSKLRTTHFVCLKHHAAKRGPSKQDCRGSPERSIPFFNRWRKKGTRRSIHNCRASQERRPETLGPVAALPEVWPEGKPALLKWPHHFPCLSGRSIALRP